eukprot:scaffold115239_cov19-Prasinocladus_malaysianus.AAC.1
MVPPCTVLARHPAAIAAAAAAAPPACAAGHQISLLPGEWRREHLCGPRRMHMLPSCRVRGRMRRNRVVGGPGSLRRSSPAEMPWTFPKPNQMETKPASV